MNRTRLLILLLPVALVLSCRTVPPPEPLSPAQVRDAVTTLRRPLSADLAALYRLRVPSASNLRLSVLTLGPAGRLSINGAFGAAQTLLSWTGGAPPVLYDLRHGCRLEAANVSALLGVTDLPLPQAILLLAGRLPALPDDEVRGLPDGRLLVQGVTWACVVSVRPEPWRVSAVEQVPARGSEGWSITVRDHALAVPSELRLEHPEGDWAELKLVGLQWNVNESLPELPELPLCGSEAE